MKKSNESLSSHDVNKNINTCVNDNLFNSSSNFSNTYIHTIQ